MTYADGRLYLRYADGDMRLAEANPKEYVEKGKFVIPNHTPARGSTVPVVAGGRLFLRDDSRLYCYDVRERTKIPQQSRIVRISVPAEAKQTRRERGGPRSVFVPTPGDVVKEMLELANVKKEDIVYDLGSGDGRIVIMASKDFGCRATGYEIDAELVDISRSKAEVAGVSQLSTFEQRDIYTADLSNADVVAVYLLPKQLDKLIPQLAKLKPGSRIVSHHFALPGAVPDEVVQVTSKEDGAMHQLFLWKTPLKLKTD